MRRGSNLNWMLGILRAHADSQADELARLRREAEFAQERDFRQEREIETLVNQRDALVAQVARLTAELERERDNSYKLLNEVGKRL